MTDDDSSRTRFMIEALTNLKNNKIKPTADGAVDNYSQLKKFLSGLKKRSGTTPEALRLTLEDIRSSSSKGKWWIVGAAWMGNPLVDAKAKGTLPSQEIESEAKLAKLARTQGMNTDIRKSVFTVLMSSEVGIQSNHLALFDGRFLVLTACCSDAGLCRCCRATVAARSH